MISKPSAPHWVGNDFPEFCHPPRGRDFGIVRRLALASARRGRSSRGLGGRSDPLPKWGEKLAATTGLLPVYVRREEGGKWVYTGLHEVTGSSMELNAIKDRLKPPVITNISRIIFLKRITVAASGGNAS